MKLRIFNGKTKVESLHRFFSNSLLATTSCQIFLLAYDLYNTDTYPFLEAAYIELLKSTENKEDPSKLMKHYPDFIGWMSYRMIDRVIQLDDFDVDKLLLGDRTSNFPLFIEPSDEQIVAKEKLRLSLQTKTRY